MTDLEDVKKENFSPNNELTAVEKLSQMYKADEIVELLGTVEKVEKIKPTVPGKPYTYTFHIYEKTLIIPSDRMVGPTMFVRRFIEEFDEMPPPSIQKPPVWREFIKALKEKKIIETVEDEIEDDYRFEVMRFLDELRDMRIVPEKDIMKNKNALIKGDKNYFLRADVVGDLREKLKMKIPQHDLIQMLLKKYLLKHDAVIRMGDKTRRCWVFCEQLKTDEIISLGSV